MKGPGQSIGGQVMGELKNLGKDIGQAVADAPGQILGQNKGVPSFAKATEGKQESGSSGVQDQTGKAIESGQQVGDSSQVKKRQSASGQGGAVPGERVVR